MKLSCFLVAATAFAQPVRTVWIHATTPAGATGAVASIRPDVHSVETKEHEVVVRSAGISLAYLSVLETSPWPRNNVRQFEFHLPLKPQPAAGTHAHVPFDTLGVFINGMPIPNYFEASSYGGQNLWHYDPITASPARPGLIEGLVANRGKHSPIIGFALDGYPIYGPWAAEGRMRSSYQWRKITARDSLPDGTVLAPGQTGPAVTPQHPLGTFAEDFEYVPGSGDLDQYNGRIAKTPEYPDGTYAYFLTTNRDGGLAYPYLLAHEYRGQFGAPPGIANVARNNGVLFQATGQSEKLLRFQIADAAGRPIRFLEHVHERPLHVLVVSEDLATFAHIHPEVTPYGWWEVTHTFPGAGRYRIYADFTPPGGNQRIAHFDLQIPGRAFAIETLRHESRVVLENADNLRAGEDTELVFRVKSPIADWRPYLGAWAHAVIVGDRLSSFLHAHPMENGLSAIRLSEAHTHTPEALGPPPERIRVAAVFPSVGRYKVWLQLQAGETVETTPFVVQVATPARRTSTAKIPAGAIAVQITPTGFDPVRVPIPAHRAVTLAFIRSGQPNCGNRVVFPELGLTREVPLGGIALVELPAHSPGELRFTCGMGMYRGSLVVRSVLAPSSTEREEPSNGAKSQTRRGK